MNDPDGRGGMTGPCVVGGGSFTRTDKDDDLGLSSPRPCVGFTLGVMG
jgi:hypothetical protein